MIHVIEGYTQLTKQSRFVTVSHLTEAHDAVHDLGLKVGALAVHEGDTALEYLLHQIVQIALLLVVELQVLDNHLQIGELDTGVLDGLLVLGTPAKNNVIYVIYVL